MEATFLMDPGFWASADPAVPGAKIEAGALRVGGLEGLVLFKTSGTTGVPKWIGLSREALLLSAAVVNRHLEVDEDSRWGLALPLNHVGGFGVVARAFEAGAELCCFDGRWDAGRFALWAGRVTHVSLVPTQVHDLVKGGFRAPSGLRAVVVGGGILPQAEGEAARRLGWPVLASYGMTEAASQIATQSLAQLDSPYATGPLPVLPHWEVRRSEEGRIGIRGASLFSGWLRPEAGGWCYEPRRGEWFESSDLGSLVEGGLVVTGRADSLVKVLGELVDPVSVERDFGMEGVVVVAVTEEREGHGLWAIFEKEELKREVELRVISYNEKAAGFRRLRGAIRLEPLPRSELGKLRRGELAAMLAARGI